MEDAILTVCSRGCPSSCSLFSDSYFSWKMVAFPSKRHYALNASNYLWSLYCLFLKDIHEENLSLSNLSPKFRSTDNLGMQGSCQCFYAVLLLNQFCILTFCLSERFLFVFNLGKIFLRFCCLGECDSDACFRCMS